MRFVLSVGLILGLASLSPAVLWVEDSFDEAAGADIHGSTSGNVDTWTVFNGNANVAASGLSYADAGYSGLTDSGNAMAMTGQNAGASSWGQATWVHSNLNSGGGQDLYMSFLFKREDSRSQMSVWFNGGFDPGGAYGAYISGAYTSATGEFRVNGYNQDTATYPDLGTGKSIGIGETALVVLKATSGGETKGISLAVNPDLTGEPIWDVTLDFPRGGFPNWMAFTASGGAGYRTQLVDEVLVGNSFAEVTPVPEPASLAVLAAAGLLARRKRQ